MVLQKVSLLSEPTIHSLLELSFLLSPDSSILLSSYLPILKNINNLSSFQQNQLLDFYYSFGSNGISYLLNQCSNGYEDNEIVILKYFTKKDDIQKKIILPALTECLTSDDLQERIYTTLAIGSFYSKAKIVVQDLREALEGGWIPFTIGTWAIRMTGYTGEHILGDILLNNKYDQIRASAAWALGISIPNNPEMIDIDLCRVDVTHPEFYSMIKCKKAENNNRMSNNNNNNNIELPNVCIELDISHFMNKLYRYYDINPIINNNDVLSIKNITNTFDLNTQLIINSYTNNNNNTLKIKEKKTNSSLLSAAINTDEAKIKSYFGMYTPLEIDCRNRYLSEIEWAQSLIETPVLQLNYDNNISIYNSIQNNNNNESLDNVPSTYCLKILTQGLFDSSVDVRIVSCIAIGNYKENSLTVLPVIMKLLVNEEKIKDSKKIKEISSIHSIALRTISLMGKNVLQLQPALLPLALTYLNDSNWSVRFSASITLSQWSFIFNNDIINILINALKKNKLKPQLFCEILINGNEECINTLLEMEKNKTLGSQVRVSIITSLSHIPVQYNSISLNLLDRIINLLLLAVEDYDMYIQANAMISLANLHHNFKELNYNISPLLNAKNILPIFYKKLKNSKEVIQKASVYSILKCGEVGEYLLIEGVLRDKNNNVRNVILNGIIAIGPEMIRIMLTLIIDGDMDIISKIEETFMKWGFKKCYQSIITSKINNYHENVEYFNQIHSLIHGIITSHNTYLSLDMIELLEQLDDEIKTII